MCWSYEVSAACTVVEAVLILFLLVRSRLSSDPWVRKQWLLLPCLTGVCLMEAIEAYIWSREDELVSVQETVEDSYRGCAKWNQRLTAFVWLFILPWQPLWVIMPCRRVGHRDNRRLLQVSEFLALVFAFANAFFYLTSSLNPAEPSMFKVQTLADSHFQNYLHNETCTYLGSSGHHLHWAYRFPDTFLAPNAFTYVLLWSSIVFAKPRRFASGIMLFAIALFFPLLLYFKLSFEAGSVWCWSAMYLFFYFVFQPYLLPCRDSTETQTGKTDKLGMTDPLLQYED